MGGGGGRESCFLQRSTSFSHERGDAFQIFCCVVLLGLIFISHAVVLPAVAVDRVAMLTAVRTATVIGTVSIGVARSGTLGKLWSCALLRVLSAGWERARGSDCRNRASNPRVGSGSASRPPNPQQKASSRLRARSRKARDD